MGLKPHITFTLLGLGFLAACAAEPTPSVKAQYQGPSFEDVIDTAQSRIDALDQDKIVIPVPKDAGGGYTHEQHKNNAKLIYDAAQLYSLTGKTAYADFAAALMTTYANLYPSWGCLLYTSPSPRDLSTSRMPSSA